MRKEVAVSVIIPFYNVEKYLGECLDSLTRQTFRDFEVILIDDGSTDESSRIAESYADRFPHCRIISKKNEGQGKARNVGLEVSCGKYIYFLDSDDYIADCALETMYAQAEKYKADLVLFGGIVFYEKGMEKYFPERGTYARRGSYPKEIYEGQEAFARLKKYRDYTCSVCLQFVRGDLVRNEKIRFPEKIAYEDEYYSFLVFMKSQRTRITADTLFYRRVRPNSTMTDKRNGRHFIGYAALCERVTEWYQSGAAKKRWRWAVRMQAADFFKGAMCRIYFKLVPKDREMVEKERLKLVQMGRQNMCYGNWRVFLVCYGWPLYKWVRDKKELG